MSDKTEDQIREGLKLLAEDVQPPEGEAERTWSLPRITPRLGAALAGVAVIATVGALAATGTFSGSRTGAAGSHHRHGPGPHVGGVMIPYMPPLWITPNRASDGTLSSVDVRVHSFSANDSVELKVIHSTPGTGDSVVYTKQVSTGANSSSCANGATGASGPTGQTGPTGASGPRQFCFNMGSTWSGTLVPSDWNGGCQPSGDYWISTADATSVKFTCSAPQAGPTGKSGPTGAAGATG